jgi:hypothetical protein
MMLTVEIGDDTIKRLAKLARLPPTADLDRFGKDVRATLTRYRDLAKQQRPPEIRNELSALWKLARRVEAGETKLKERLAESFNALSMEARQFLGHRLERFGGRGGPMPTVAELSDTGAAQQAAARLRSLLQQGATSEPWSLELSNLAEYAERVGFGSAMRARQIGNTLSEDVRKRWQESATKLSAIERTTLVTQFAQLSSSAKKRLRQWAIDKGLAIPKQEELTNQHTAIEAARRLASILAYGETFKRRRKPLLWAPNVGRGRSVQEAARELVMLLAIDYMGAKGQCPASTANPRAPGPFVRLVTEVLKLAGTPHVDAVELVTWYGLVRRQTRVSGGFRNGNR